MVPLHHELTPSPPRFGQRCSVFVYARTENDGYCAAVVRKSNSVFERNAVEALVDALRSIDITASSIQDKPGAADLLVEAGGVPFVVEVKSVVTAGDGARFAQGGANRDRATVVVADRIAEGAKEEFRRAGVNFYDRRGHLRILRPPIVIDVVLPSEAMARGRSTGPLSSQVAKEVAITCLLTPDRPHGVREVATYIERVPSAVSTAMADLRAEGLLTSAGEASVPDLFHELATAWRRGPVPLADLPRPGAGRVNDQLDLGFEDAELSSGWALTDTLAAASWGMPVVARGDYPPDFYVPSDAHLRRARALLGETSNADRRACTVAVAPVRLACLRRVDHAKTSGEVWPVADHIVVALDLAQDKARGLGILDRWHPKDIVRAW